MILLKFLIMNQLQSLKVEKSIWNYLGKEYHGKLEIKKIIVKKFQLFWVKI